MIEAMVLAAAVVAAGPRPFPADPPKVCDSCAQWNAPREPFRVHGNTYYVGTAELSAILVTSPEGHILIDGGLPQSAALIDRNIRALGFRTEDVKVIANSHAHFDHAGGIAALQRATGAVVAASAAGARALQAGKPTPDDPQYALPGDFNSFPPVKTVNVVGDGRSLKSGTLEVRAYLTPGHTPGSTTWTWLSCDDAGCVDVVYADSLTAVSADGFRYGDEKDSASAAAAFRRGINRVASLPCDVLLTPHPSASGMDEKLQRRAADPKQNPFVDRNACRAYAANASRGLDRRLAEEAGPAVSPAPPVR